VVGFTPVVGTRGFYAVTGGSCIDWARDIKVGEKMKVVFSCFMGSKDNHGPAYTVRKQANKLFAVYHGSHPIYKDIVNLPVAVNIVMSKLNIWERI